MTKSIIPKNSATKTNDIGGEITLGRASQSLAERDGFKLTHPSGAEPGSMEAFAYEAGQALRKSFEASKRVLRESFKASKQFLRKINRALTFPMAKAEEINELQTYSKESNGVEYTLIYSKKSARNLQKLGGIEKAVDNIIKKMEGYKEEIDELYPELARKGVIHRVKIGIDADEMMRAGIINSLNSKLGAFVSKDGSVEISITNISNPVTKEEYLHERLHIHALNDGFYKPGMYELMRPKLIDQVRAKLSTVFNEIQRRNNPNFAPLKHDPIINLPTETFAVNLHGEVPKSGDTWIGLVKNAINKFLNDKNISVDFKVKRIPDRNSEIIIFEDPIIKYKRRNMKLGERDDLKNHLMSAARIISTMHLLRSVSKIYENGSDILEAEKRTALISLLASDREGRRFLEKLDKEAFSNMLDSKTVELTIEGKSCAAKAGSEVICPQARKLVATRQLGRQDL